LADDAPYLPRGVRLRWCAVREAWFLLGPERALKMDAIGVAILQALAPGRTFADVVAGLAAEFGAPPERVETDARAFLASLIDRRLVDVT
jgi:pyrroloquinoline quinone biosynthesis protein D